MDMLSTLIGMYTTVSSTDNEYRLLYDRLSYELKKAQHLLKTDKVKSIPKFMLDNLKTKIHQAQSHQQKISTLLSENQLSLQLLTYQRKQKIKLSLPFNKTNRQVSAALEALEKAHQDVLDYSNAQSDSQNQLGKRSLDVDKIKPKKEETMITIGPNEEVNDEDIEEALMGPTIEEDAAIQFTKNKYVLLQIEIQAKPKILKTIKESAPELTIFKEKLQIKFDPNPQNSPQYLELFTINRLYFKKAYSKLKAVWADVDRISKKDNHFVIKLKRTWENSTEKVEIEQQLEKSEKKLQQSSKSNPSDQFYSFPATNEQFVKTQSDSIVIEKGDKTMFFIDETGQWVKMSESQKELANGDLLAFWVEPGVQPQEPDLYFKIDYKIFE